jgi:hypothetical protein
VSSQRATLNEIAEKLRAAQETTSWLRRALANTEATPADQLRYVDVLDKHGKALTECCILIGSLNQLEAGRGWWSRLFRTRRDHA